MGGVWVMDLREGGSGTDRCVGDQRKEQKVPLPEKKGCPEKQKRGSDRCLGGIFIHVPALCYGWFIYWIFHPVTLICLLIDDIV